jgi:hypothetical protein
MSIDAGDHAMGRVLRLPVTSAAGETAALRAEVVEVLRSRRSGLVEEMCGAVRRAGLAPLLETGGVALERRVDQAVGMAFAAWGRGRPPDAAEAEGLRALGAAVARSGVPSWRLLNAVQVAARAGWEYTAEHALFVVEEARRPRLAARLVAELAVAAMDVLGRVETLLAMGYGDVRPPRRAAAVEVLRG